MGTPVVVVGTGYEGRAEIIRRHIEEGQEVFLVREPENQYDSNAIAVYVEVRKMFKKTRKQIGYLKEKRAKTLSKRMDDGESIAATVYSYFAPDDKEHPRVSLNLEL